MDDVHVEKEDHEHLTDEFGRVKLASPKPAANRIPQFEFEMPVTARPFANNAYCERG